VFSIFKKRTPKAIPGGLSGLRADMHCHLVPGIDDGAPNLETSLTLIRGMMDLGYKKIISTPHVMGELYPNARETILTGAETVRRTLVEEGMDVDFSAAAEYMLDDHFSNLLEKEIPLLPVKDNMVLVEFSFASPPLDFKEKIFAMQISGYRPIIAHPERYSYLHYNRKVYDELKQTGCLFQVNLLSLVGYYGKPAAEVAQYLLKKDYVDLLGSDLHHEKHLGHLHSPELAEQVARIIGTRSLLNPSL